MLDALAYLKAARAAGCPGRAGGVPVGDRAPTRGCSSPPRSRRPPPGRSAPGCCARRSPCAGGWTWPATTGSSPPRTCVAVGGLGNLIAAPLQGRARRRGATVFLDLGHPGAARGPVGLPVHRRPADAERGRSARGTGSARSTSVPGSTGSAPRPRPGSPSPPAGGPCPTWARRSRSTAPTSRRRCWPPSSTPPRCPTRSSTSGSGAGPPPGTPRGSCAATTRPSPATWSCPAA